MSQNLDQHTINILKGLVIDGVNKAEWSPRWRNVEYGHGLLALHRIS